MVSFPLKLLGYSTTKPKRYVLKKAFESTRLAVYISNVVYLASEIYRQCYQ
jgi:hypothetical protein